MKMNLEEALMTAEEIMNIIATGQDGTAVNMREYICDKLDITEDVLIESWYKISRRNEK